MGLAVQMKRPLHVGVDPWDLRQASPKTYLVRFTFGGGITAVAGVIAELWGPSVGGLFLAFPAILPASITLIERHDGQRAAGADALGAAVGSAGLAAFGALVWLLAPQIAAWQVLVWAALLWLFVAVVLWAAFEWTRRAGRGSGDAARPPPRPTA
jgi:Protein of unknown function (DUF3147)